MQLSTRLSIPKSSLHALLRTMVDRGWLETDPSGSVYRLGIHSLVVSSAYLDSDPVLARATSVLDEVAAATEETAHLGRRDMVPDHIATITPHTTTDRDAVLVIIEHAAHQGYATASEESCMGVRCFGVALPFTRHAVDALSVAVPISRLVNGREDLIIETLLRVKSRLTAALGSSLGR